MFLRPIGDFTSSGGVIDEYGSDKSNLEEE